MHSWHSGENGSSQLTGDGVRIVNNPVENLKRCDKFTKRLLRKVKQERIYHKWDITHKTIFCNLKAAWQSVFPSVPWQRCQFHLQQNVSSHIPKKSMELKKRTRCI